ncbi:complement factor H [Anableps anableps]
MVDLTYKVTKVGVQWEENHLHSEERLSTRRFNSKEVGLRQRELYPDSLDLFPQPVMEILLDTRRRRKLLILYLFIGNVAAYCPRPEAAENMVLSDAALLKNDFPEGSEVTLECGNGYEKDTGSGIINCLDQKWTEPDLVCKKKDCGPPQAEPHMYFDIREGTLFGSVVKVMCDEGYRIRGVSYKHCYAHGWSGRAKCNIVTCARPTEVENGQSSWNTDNVPEYQQLIHFTCNTGYTMLGNQSIRCTKTGEYDSQPPQCVRLTTEDKITTRIATSAPATTEQEISSTEGLTTTPTSTTVTARVSINISPPEQEYRLTPCDKNTSTTSESTSTSLKGQNIETLNMDKAKGNTAVVISVVVVTLVLCIIIFFLNKFLMRRKGSVGTGAIC